MRFICNHLDYEDEEIDIRQALATKKAENTLVPNNRLEKDKFSSTTRYGQQEVTESFDAEEASSGDEDNNNLSR
ncbi:MAG: hypothetical protein ACK4R7_05235, partial [Fervidobacterium sp.]